MACGLPQKNIIKAKNKSELKCDLVNKTLEFFILEAYIRTFKSKPEHPNWGIEIMQRHRRRTPGTTKLSLNELENGTELNGLLEARLRHRQLKAELELLKLEKKLNQQIRWLQNRRLDQLTDDPDL